MLLDVVIAFSAVMLAAFSVYGASSLTGLYLPEGPSLLLVAAEFALVMALTHAFVGLYRPQRLATGAVVRRTVFAVACGGAVSYALWGFTTYTKVADELIFGSLLYLLAGILLLRGVARVVRALAEAPRVLVVGAGPEAISVVQDLAAAHHFRREVVGMYPGLHCDPAGASVAGVAPVLDAPQGLAELVDRQRVNEVIVAVREQRGGGVPMDELLACRIRGVRVLDLAAYYERARSEVRIDSLKASWLVYGDGFVQGPLRQAAKRTFDILSSSLLLLLASPVMLLAMLAIRLDSPGPVLYRQERVGLGGRSFMCIKFRSMRTDAEKDGVARWATKNDSRVTRVGAFIRKTRIDELPQLISVLKGEMSMVGPRPERPSFVAQLREQIPFYDLRHSVKPGVTGWAQVRYSYGASVEDARRKHQYDLYYVKHNSLLLDMLVLLETVSVVLFREGQ
ncbi:TIGR03013 family XrtA/PEP-CTERM system glycosyltransferase [Piscinibacter sp.]|uniref:TIGR03013 family XrtA/PEP-CTERM system glycosyltransferase n=1 Tax=Piscinibacter sp. TaxID=1903157 RepID=UPI0039E23B64